MSTPNHTFLPALQNPPRFIQDFLYPYVKNVPIWFCPNVGKDRTWGDDPTRATYGFNGTTYGWVHTVLPGQLYAYPTWPGVIWVSGRALAAIPRPAEAAVVFDQPPLLPINKAGCPPANPAARPAHAKGLNALYADGHARFEPFGSQTNGSLWDDPKHPCIYDWGTDHGWQGYFE